ncbi:FAD:protein FMN transferase [Tsukamurella sp. 8F]|uniref:FAD:protein FMN transferase n=1 Tax=unclassified Tsukamurella TaxID=2633480 RepID=UPI0023B9F421|nr:MULTISPECIES: FAD:protein FMN transferase [unclassified Tsukamurella]MDF0530448.1 FAD:protein FMN transferase [Tsukamurella sp. 8J]MDF0587731.1 FAD:protein FMN transferase [Tsukamurella sp. 8F]
MPAAGAQWRFDGIGTEWQVDTAEPLGGEMRAQITALVERYDGDWSRFRPGTVVDALRAGPGRHRMPADAGPLIDVYDRLYRLTDGAMSAAVGDGLERLGYDAHYSLVPSGPARPAPIWDENRWDPPFLTTKEPFVLDVGAAGKGYLADQIADIVARDHAEFTIDGSGDLVRKGPAVTVALEHPLDPSLAIGTTELTGALCASAINRRAWGEGLHHLLDARTGIPVHGVLATWVWASDARTADALATALFFAPAERLRSEFDFRYALMTDDQRVHHDADLPAELFT